MIISSQILWRTVKYEEVYIHSYDTVKEARESLDNYFRFYNSERLHQSLGYKTPQEVYLNEIINKQEEIIHLKSLFSVLTMGSTLNLSSLRSEKRALTLVLLLSSVKLLSY